MSTDARFRLFFGDRPATQDELDRIDEITVEQETDKVWEAQIKMHLCLDEEGNWMHQQEEFLSAFSRIRVELQVGEKPYLPLIDGPIVEHSSALDSEPGKSQLTVVVHDDSAWLNREEEYEPFEGRAAHEIARELFERVPQIDEVRVEEVDPPAEGLEGVTTRRGTPMHLLRQLARQNEFHAYVLPGSERGKSIGCFLPDPREIEGLPELILLGERRNLANFDVREDAQSQTRFRGRSLSIVDKQLVAATSRFRDFQLLGPRSAVEEDRTGTQLLSPSQNREEDPTRAVQSAARRASYAFEGSGRVMPGCYTGILRPYQLVAISAGSTPLTGDWLLTKATHRINVSVYTQEFTAKRDAASETNEQPDLLGQIF